MKSVSGSVGTLALAGVAGLGALHTAAAFPFSDNTRDNPLSRRDVTANGDAFSGLRCDYVIVGGGLAGLTLAARLSEDPDVQVCVIEAGLDIYGEHQSRFLTPSAVLYDSFLNTEYDWKYVTTPQPGLNQRVTACARAKVLGGGSAINSMYMVRASAREFDSWGSLIGAPEQWGWNSMLAAMKKSEDFQEPAQAVRDTVPSLKWNPASHGVGGNIKTGWPAISYPFVQSFFNALMSLGTPVNSDPDNGDSWGAFLATSAINNQNWQRSSARTGYLDSIDTERPNLHVLVGHQVTKVLFDTSNPDSVRATGVQYAAGPNAPLLTVNAGLEVIISGGTINSPQILQLSGIGDADQLSKLGIQPVINLPGVGHNVQDHVSAALIYAPKDQSKQPPAKITGDPVIDSFVQSAVAYIDMATLVGADKGPLLDALRANIANTINSAAVPDVVKQAWNVTYTSQVNKIYDSPVGLVEILLADIFGSVNIQVALQQPLSRGSILITSADPFAPPAIDPGYLTQDIDLHLLREGHKFARRIGAAMTDVLAPESQPGAAAVTDDAGWDAYIRQNAGTEYHPSSSCSMLPREQGGVVDKDLRVYSTANLRVMDASIAPTSVSAHLMTATYGIAEIGADLIKAARRAAAPPAPVRLQQANEAGPAPAAAEPQLQAPPQPEEAGKGGSNTKAVVSAGVGTAAVGSVLVAGMVLGRTALRRWHEQKYSKVVS